jgi:hypothetical protein
MTEHELRLHFQAALRAISEAVVPTWGPFVVGPHESLTTASTALGMRDLARDALNALDERPGERPVLGS